MKKKKNINLQIKLDFKLVFLILLILAFGFTLIIFKPKDKRIKVVNPEIYVQSQALNIAFNPASGNLNLNQNQTITLTLNANTSKISAFDLTLQTTNNLKIMSVAAPVPQSSTAVFEQIFKGSIPSNGTNSVRLVYASKDAQASLPSRININLVIKDTVAEQAVLKISNTNYQFVGPNPNLNWQDYVYPVNFTQGSYIVAGPSPSPSPGSDPKACISDCDCVCGALTQGGNCDYLNKNYAQDVFKCTMLPDFCYGFSGNGGPRCVNNQCKFIDPAQPTQCNRDG